MSATSRRRKTFFLQQLQDFPPLTSISKKPSLALADARFLEGEETRGLFRCTKGRAATGRCVTVRRPSGANVSGEHRSARRRCDKQGWTRMSWNAALYARGATTGRTKPFKQLSSDHEQFLRSPAKGRISLFHKKLFIRGEKRRIKSDDWKKKGLPLILQFLAQSGTTKFPRTTPRQSIYLCMHLLC